MAFKKFALPLVALAALTGPVIGQDGGNHGLPISSAGNLLELATLGHKVVMPFPAWLADRSPDAASLRDITTVKFSEIGDQATLEIYPRGEGEAFWSTLYGARITRQADATLEQMRSVIIDVYARACRPETVALFQLEPDEGDAIPPLGFVCGEYLHATGYVGRGEVMVMGFYKSETGSAMIYQEWQGEAFNPSDSTTWPVSTEEIEARIAQLKTEIAFGPVD
ncbi:MAG: hypothetical protein GX970_02435 [Phyllobacteriaceae bacterium]|nr:hypothetical protein [Phyllobacteriaceae bacterium]